MNTVTKSRWLMTAIVLLLLVNLVMLGMLWMGRDTATPEHRGPGSTADFIIRETGMDEQQQAAYRLLIEEHQRSMGQLRAAAGEGKNRFFELLKQPGVSDSVVRNAAIQANEKMEELDMITFRHFEKVRALCRPDQQDKFDRIIQQALRAMPGPGGPGRPGPGRPDHPGGPPPHE